MKPDAVAMLSSIIILILGRHTMAIGRRRFRCFHRRNRHRKRWQSQRKKEYDKADIAEHWGAYSTSDVKSEQHDIAVFDKIFLAF
jgi:hypothetical protein